MFSWTRQMTLRGIFKTIHWNVICLIVYQARTLSARCVGEKTESNLVSKMAPIIIVHGGAGDIPDSRVKGKLDGMKVAVTAGHEILMKGGSALDAVEAAVVAMEKDENFNAGYGSVLTLRGEVEMEASIMRGQDLNVGGVTLVKEFLHPISIAHKVLTDSPHSLLGGEGAKLFALEKGFKPIPPESLISENAKRALDRFLKHGEFGRTEIGPKDEGGVGTVGAVAIDCQGHIAAATSTGGMSGKAVGRIGDTPQIGSGTYADDHIGGVSTTGHGESILKYCLAHSIIKLMENGTDANTATTMAVNGMTSRLHNTAGAITLSKNGEVGVHFSSNRMSWAYIRDGQIFYGINPGEQFCEKYEPEK
ncbi:probable isoaspartyl peptidase/L-asparaginase GA20639 isoform X1 [Spodoptera frugiperda]|uniref:Probable isoaspartyl peptidase/L-asparaginase GA20639 isoform X1 n=2 Tax=Spodoptera frugiperda TaxID=7108 RepID=A0A9R0EGU7_SPOFR|nr:probable isoaspartyl peptidase/L-asparaginase GA20639 isoform X1 [Spodoptera frugiperda]